MFELIPELNAYPDHVVRATCIACGADAGRSVFTYTCPECGANLDLEYDYDAIQAQWTADDLMTNSDRSLWRYTPLLPVHSQPRNRTLEVGGTPLVYANRLAEHLGFRELWIKDDTRNPSASLKDRASAIGVQHAGELGLSTIVAASTGNAAASLASLSANAELNAIIFAPAAAPPAKLTQILQYGATLVAIDGNYDIAFDLAREAADHFGWYNRNTGMNPVLVEGKKTVALEIAQQLHWDVPDFVIVPVGDGCILSGVYKGFYDLLQLGWIERMPRLVAVQAEGSPAIVNAFSASKLVIEPVSAKSIADSITVNMPRDGRKALRALRESAGCGVLVSDEGILQAQYELAALTGIFAEPAAAAAYAGLRVCHATGEIPRDARIVLLITGSGLKDIPAAQKQVQIPQAVAPEMAAVERYLEQLGTLEQDHATR